MIEWQENFFESGHSRKWILMVSFLSIYCPRSYHQGHEVCCIQKTASSSRPPYRYYLSSEFRAHRQISQKLGGAFEERQCRHNLLQSCLWRQGLASQSSEPLEICCNCLLSWPYKTFSSSHYGRLYAMRNTSCVFRCLAVSEVVFLAGFALCHACAITIKILLSVEYP